MRATSLLSRITRAFRRILRSSGIRREPPPKPPVRVAVIGTGRHATRFIYPALRTAPAVLEVVCSRTAEKAERTAQAWGALRHYTDYNRMLDREAGQLDAVFVIGPPQLHFEAGLAVLQHGLHLFVDKPPAPTLQSAEELAGAARTARRLAMTGFNRRYSATWLQAQRLLAGLPAPDHIELSFATWNSEPLAERLLMMDIHYLDAARYFMGEIAEINAFRARTGSNGLAAALRFENGATGTLLVTDRASLLRERIAIFAGSTLLELDNLRALRVYPPSTAEVTGLSVSGAMLYEGDHWNQGAALGFEGEVQHFCRAVQGVERLSTSLDDGVAAMRLVERLARVE